MRRPQVKSLLVALGIATVALVPVLGVQAASADPAVDITANCNAMTFTYTGFPGGGTVTTVDSETVVQLIGNTSTTISDKSFTFTDSTFTDTVPINAYVSDTTAVTFVGNVSWDEGGGEQRASLSVGPCGTAPCPSATKANFRWHYSANGTSGSWSGTRSVVCPGSLTTAQQAMEGDLKVAPGTMLQAGYDFTVPGNNTTLSVTVTNPQVVFTLNCVSGAAASPSTFTVGLPDPTTYPVTGSAWYPSGDQHSPLVYEFSGAVPDACGGGLVRLNKGGTFSAQVS